MLMASRIFQTTVDCRDAFALSQWWKQVLDYVDIEGDPNLPGHEECIIQRADSGHQVLFIEVDDVKVVKNRLHFDLRPTDRSRDDEIDRLVGSGATLVADLRLPDGTGWATLADPEGNEFCVLRSDAEVAAAG